MYSTRISIQQQSQNSGTKCYSTESIPATLFLKEDILVVRGEDNKHVDVDD